MTRFGGSFFVFTSLISLQANEVCMACRQKILADGLILKLDLSKHGAPASRAQPLHLGEAMPISARSGSSALQLPQDQVCVCFGRSLLKDSHTMRWRLFFICTLLYLAMLLAGAMDWQGLRQVCC